MSIFYPDLVLRHVSDLCADTLHAWGVKAVLLDVDNTLTTHNNPNPGDKIKAWLDEMKNAGFHLVILSNNYEKRVKPFAEKLALDYTAYALKPLGKGFRETAARLGVEAGEMVMIGDQIFTDVLGGNLFGARTVLVDPIEPEGSAGFRLKRALEKSILRSYYRHHIKGAGCL